MKRRPLYTLYASAVLIPVATMAAASPITVVAGVEEAHARIVSLALLVVSAVAIAAAAVLTYQVKRVLSAVDRIPSKEWFAEREADSVRLAKLLGAHDALHPECGSKDCEGSI